MHLLVTAGPTREHIDPVRYIGNSASGITGFHIAARAVALGHDVTLVSGPVSLEPPKGVDFVSVVSADQMYRACRRVFPEIDALIMSAAVCDYRPKRRSGHKQKKTAGGLSLPLVRTVDILAELGQRRRADQVLIGFALEDRAARKSAEAKLINKHLDAIVLNSPDALGNSHNTVSVLYHNRWHDWPTMTKRALGLRLVRLAERLLASGG